MSENRRRVLDMLAEGKISVEEAERLLSLVDQQPASEIETTQWAPMGDLAGR